MLSEPKKGKSLLQAPELEPVALSMVHHKHLVAWVIPCQPATVRIPALA